MNSDIMHIVAHEKGKPVARRGRKSTGSGLNQGSGATKVSRDCRYKSMQINGGGPRVCVIVACRTIHRVTEAHQGRHL